MLRVVLLGPPGCGKGTQAERLKVREGLLHLSTGDLLRAAVAAGTPLGRRAKPLMEAGKLVPDDLVIDLVRERIAAERGGKGFLLNGFPRTVPQADALDRVLGAVGSGAVGSGAVSSGAVGSGRGLDVVVYYVLGDEEIVRRGLGRGRADDTEPVLRERLRVYRTQTEPLVARYREAGLLEEVDAAGAIDEVERLTQAAIARRTIKGGGTR